MVSLSWYHSISSLDLLENLNRTRRELIHSDSFLLQVPNEVLAMILTMFSKSDLKDFRCTCKSWKEAQNFLDIGRRVQLSVVADWQTQAKEIERRLPHLSVVVHTANPSDILDLSQSKFCDKLVFTLDPVLLYGVWSHEPESFLHHKDSLLRLRKAGNMLQQCSHPHCMETNMQVRAGRLKDQALRTAIGALTANIALLRVLEGIHIFTAAYSPVTSICTLELYLPQQASRIEEVQAALHNLPQLRALCLFKEGDHKPHLARSFCSVLSTLPKVTDLRLAMDDCPICLFANELQNITCLGLSRQAIFEAPPANLRSLSLYDISKQEDLAVIGQQLASLSSLSSMQICEFDKETLCQLPAHLLSLTLHSESEFTEFCCPRYLV